MLTDSGSSAADREARNEYLIDVDEAWEGCRDTVERARSAYDEALESSRAKHEAEQTDAASAHHLTLDESWAQYKQDAGDRRAERRTVARATYNEAAATGRKTYDEGMTTSRHDYVKAVQDARLGYESSVDEAFAAHREAIRSVRRFLEPIDGDAGLAELEGMDDIKAIQDLKSIDDLDGIDAIGDIEAYHLQLAGELAAHGSDSETPDEHGDNPDSHDEDDLMAESAVASLNGSDA